MKLFQITLLCFIAKRRSVYTTVSIYLTIVKETPQTSMPCCNLSVTAAQTSITKMQTRQNKKTDTIATRWCVTLQIVVVQL